MELNIKRVEGRRLEPHLDDLAGLRIAVFREFPYLYDGDPDYEARYLETHLRAPQSLAVFVFDGTRMVGASTVLPLTDETEEVKAPFVAAGLPPESFFYFGESVLLSEYRGGGLGARFFEAREAHARALGSTQACFCAVERPHDHPRRPEGYRPLYAFWEGRGFVKRPELKATFSWRGLGEAAESPKPMTFWTKRL